MKLLSDKLMFLFYFCFHFILSVYGFTVNDNGIKSMCRLECDFNMEIDGDNFYCNRQCQVDQCLTGCELYSYAIAIAPCQDICTDNVHQNVSILEQTNSVTHIQKQSCIQGCTFGLDKYYKEFADLDLPELEVVKDSITHSSVELSWSAGEYTLEDLNITYILQERVLDTSTAWQIHNDTETLSSGILNVTSLRPYLTYKFKLIFKITTSAAHVIETDESYPVSTLPYGAPSTAPVITSLRGPSPTVVSLAWTKPVFTNGPLISYRLTLLPLGGEGHETSKDVPSSATSWIFGHLHAGQKYQVGVSAVNAKGEGPAHVMSVTTPTPGNLTDAEQPYLVLGAENMVVKQRLLELTRTAEVILDRPKSISITGVGVYVAEELVVVSDDSGRVTLISVSGDQESGDIYPTLIQPTSIDIDWLNRHAYIVDRHRIYQCTIRQTGNQCKVVLDMVPILPKEVKVDPINGYLYYIVTDHNRGLYRVDLADFKVKDKQLVPTLLLDSDLHTFFIDHDNLLLYYPNNTKNTIMSAYLDGTGVTDMRQGTVASPHFTNIESMISYDEKFFWTNGTKVFREEYDKGNRTYYHNSLLLFEKHFRGFNMYFPRAQPIPVPVNPPSDLQVLFTAYKAVIQWNKPDILTFQGAGAYNKWDYEVNILQDDGSNNAVHQTAKQMKLVVSNLEPDTQYQVKVRATSRSGTGPWSPVFYGRTIRGDLSSAKMIVAVEQQYNTWEMREVGLDGEIPTILLQTSMLYPGVTDLAWYDDNLLWTTDDGDLFLYHGNHGDGSDTMQLEFVMDAASVTYDWLAKKLYWSVKRNQWIKRADMRGNNVDTVYQALARDMTLDSVKGRLYWVTMYAVETTRLDGSDHAVYFSVPVFDGKHVISLAIDPGQQKLVWYVKGYEYQSLYVADLYGYHDNDHDVINSAQLISNFKNIEMYSPLQYFSNHLYWVDSDMYLTVGDSQCNYTSSVSAIEAPVTMFTLKHPSLHQYPENLNRSTIQVIPSSIQPDTIGCQGVWSNFNVTWQPSVEVNHGHVTYELSIQTEGIPHKLELVSVPWYTITGVAPFTPVTVSVRGFTYWGSGPLTTTTVKSPMAAPTQPQSPKVYVSPRKNAATSKLTLAADFRWVEPDEINGVLSEQHVFYWRSSNPGSISSTTILPSTRHFILDNLQGNTTYFFQIESCTPAGCSPRSLVANATANSVNPVPKLLIATRDKIEVAEADYVKNTSVTIATKSVVAMGYLAQDERYYWLTRDRHLEQSQHSTDKRLLQLEGEGRSMTVDWVSRILYIVEGNSTATRIVQYLVDQSEHRSLIDRDASIGHIVVDPYTSTLMWSELDKQDNTWKIMKSSTDGANITQQFTTSRRRRDNTACNCPANQKVSVAMAMDLSADGHTEMIYIDVENNQLMASDIQGCRCRTLLSTTPADRKGLPADYMSVDHVYIYWYHAATQTLYTMDKETSQISSSSVPDVAAILAFGAHLHPLPGSECLDTEPYTDKVDVKTFTNTSAVVSLHEVSWPESCGSISHPSVKYTVFYRKLDDMNPNDDCRPSGQHCMSVAAYKRELTLTGLKPYTYYILQGAISNYYSQNSATSLGEPTQIRTKPGMPSAVENITASPQNPNNITVSWQPPLHTNGPLHSLVYYVKWSIALNGIFHGLQTTDPITYDQLGDYNGRFNVKIGKLTPDQTYSIKVICNQTEGNFITESQPVWVHTFMEPEDIELLDMSNTSIHLTWRSPSDDSIARVSISYTEVSTDTAVEFVNKMDDLPMVVDNYTLYNETFSDLQPNTDYAFRLNIIYRESFKVYHWPKDGSELKYVFRTLTGIPGLPDPPIVEEFKSGEFEISWTAPENHGEKITHYILQYRSIDKENWTEAYNTSDLRWVLDDTMLQRGYTYLFRVMAYNKNGWGPYSLNSSLFSYPIMEAESEDGMIKVIAIVVAFIFVVIAMAVIAVIFSVCKRRKEEKKKKNQEFMAVSRGPDLELATLRELPMNAIQQNNTLYAMNLVPTDDEVAALPHFRRDQLVLCKFLGSGAFGEVFEGIAKNIINESSGDTRCAVKTLRKSASDQEKEEFLKEALLMSNFHHEHILSLLGVCLDNDPQFIILELMEGGDLLSFMRACRLSSIQNRSELSLADLVKICVHVSRGCKYLEDMHFVHRDLAARNCLVSSCNPANMVVKIGDFGLARDIYKNDYYRKEGEGLLPVRWMSPESLVDGVFTTQSDIWAFGVMMWEVVTFGQQPYPARTNIEVLHFVRTGGLLDRPDNCPDDFYQLMCKCWSFAPEDRPSFAYLLQQLEKFQETCASISEYLVPLCSNNGPIAAVDGYKYLTQRSRRQTSTSSDGPDTQATDIQHNGYGSHSSYGKIRRATSFDAPEPKDATQQVITDSSNYLEPKSKYPPTYMEFLPDSRTENYVYNISGERVRDSNTRTQDFHTLPRHPSYVQTTVKENFFPSGAEYMKYIQQKSSFSNGEDNDNRKFTHQKSSADSVIGKTVENIPEMVNTDQRNQDNSSNDACSESGKIADGNVTYAQVMQGMVKKSNRFRKHRLDSSNSIMSFDSVQTEPAYVETPKYRTKLYSSSSSKSNYSMSNISESLTEQNTAEQTDSQPRIDEECQQFWANKTNNSTNLALKGQSEVKGHVDYLNLGRRGQVYPESPSVLPGYDKVQATLV